MVALQLCQFLSNGMLFIYSSLDTEFEEGNSWTKPLSWNGSGLTSDTDTASGEE